MEKKFGPFLDLCVSSLRRGYANLLCIVPILSDVPEGTTPVGRCFHINAFAVPQQCINGGHLRIQDY
ncbi:hypothetical protein ES332_A05G394400v1 [Gossypium tomentosum]|uniref:Uncharacterized protein n=1 Tax=Gossypium tomentosum TaxID=34277 RepID=A0A5D2QST1_GOSTO|nr:hypothetical protein ES332_A05G394400v1 [Gossypium tomentosum]